VNKQTKYSLHLSRLKGSLTRHRNEANAHYGKYANLDSYISGSAEGLKNNGLAILQDTYGPEDKQIIKCENNRNSQLWTVDRE